jgi:predicted dehydrogenase
MNTEPFRLGMIGLAHLHPRSYMAHLLALPEVMVTAAAEPDPAILGPFTRDFPMEGYGDWREMIDEEKLDLALIFLPHALCPEAAAACAERGIHLLVEKPMAAASQGIRRMMEATRTRGVLLTAPYVWRFHCVARRMKALVREGILGQVVACTGRCAAGRLHRYLEGHARWMLTRALSGGGPMHNLGVHWIDLFRWLLEDEAVEVVGRTLKVNPEYDIEDHSNALVQFSRGAVLDLDISYTVPDSFPYGRDLFLSLRGTRGCLSWSPSFEGIHETLFVCSNEGEYSRAENQEVAFELPACPGYGGQAGLDYLKMVIQCLHEKVEPSITAMDGLKALQIVEAIYRSAETRRTEPVPA